MSCDSVRCYNNQATLSPPGSRRTSSAVDDGSSSSGSLPGAPPSTHSASATTPSQRKGLEQAQEAVAAAYAGDLSGLEMFSTEAGRELLRLNDGERPVLYEAAITADDDARGLLHNLSAPLHPPHAAWAATRVHEASAAGAAAVLAALLEGGAPAATRLYVGGHHKSEDGDEADLPLMEAPLDAACRGGHADCVALLLNRTSFEELHSVNPQNKSAGHFALKAADGPRGAACLRLLLNAGFCFSAPEEEGGLVPAAAAGAAECLEELLQLRQHAAAAAPPAAEATGPDRGLRAALARACHAASVPCVELLFQYGATPQRPADDTDDDRESPLSAAVCGGSADCLELLLTAAGGDPGRDGPGALRVAATRSEASPGKQGCLPRLLAAGVDPGARDNRMGVTALHSAASNGSSFAVRLLCAHGADPNARLNWHNGGRRAPIQWASQRVSEIARLPGPKADAEAQCLLEIFDELLERGSDLLFTEQEYLPNGTPCRIRPPLEQGLTEASRAVGFGNAHADFEARRPHVPPLALLLARWPPDADLGDENSHQVWGEAGLLPAALEIARARLETLRGGRQPGSAALEALKAAFLRRVDAACGGAVAPRYAPFARLRFVEGGRLERAAGFEREVHRFPVERVAIAAARLKVTIEAEAAAAEASVPVLREGEAFLSLGPGGGRGGVRHKSDDGDKAAERWRYAVVRVAGRWGEIKAAVAGARAAEREAVAALDASIEEAAAAVKRLEERNAAHGFSSGGSAPGGSMLE